MMLIPQTVNPPQPNPPSVLKELVSKLTALIHSVNHRLGVLSIHLENLHILHFIHLGMEMLVNIVENLISRHRRAAYVDLRPKVGYGTCSASNGNRVCSG